MNTTRKIKLRILVLVTAIMTMIVASDQLRADTGVCGGASTTLPFTDVQSSNIFFCSIAQAYFSGLTNGTTATTYSASQAVPREQMAAFIARTQDSALKRGSRRAAMKQWWTPASTGAIQSISLGDDPSFPSGIVYDGADIWVAVNNGFVKRVRASDGKILQTWSIPSEAGGLIVAAGRVFVLAIQGGSPGKIYVIDPTGTPGPGTVFENSIGIVPREITFDGKSLWTANLNSISRVDITTGIDSTFSAGFVQPIDILWDGANLWVLDTSDSHLKRVDALNGSVVESIPVIPSPRAMAFDGANIWVVGGGDTPNSNISVVRAVGGLRGTVLASLRAAGPSPFGVAFDGERILVCNLSGDSVSLFKATDFTPLGTVSTGFQTNPDHVCSDGVNFWLTVGGSPPAIMRF